MTTDPVARFFAQRAKRFDRRARIRPLSTSEVVDMSLRLYQRLGMTFLRLTVVPTLFCLASFAFVLEYVLPSLLTSKDPENFRVQLGEVSGALLLALFIGGPLFLMGLSYTTSLVVQLVSDFMVGNVPSEEAALQTARKTAPRLFAVNLRELLISVSGLLIATALMLLGGWIASKTPDDSIWAGLVALVGILGLLIGGIVFLQVLAVHSLATPISVIEQLRPVAASKRSKQLLAASGYIQKGTGAVWTVYGLIFVFLLVVSSGIWASFAMLDLRSHFEALVTGLPLSGLWLTAFDLVPLFLLFWTVIPVWATAITIIYYERRIRLEGFDIESLAAEIPKSGRTSRFEL